MGLKTGGFRPMADFIQRTLVGFNQQKLRITFYSYAWAKLEMRNIDVCLCLSFLVSCEGGIAPSNIICNLGK